MFHRTRATVMLILLLVPAWLALADPDDGAAGLRATQATMLHALQQADADALVDCYTADARLSFPLRPDIEGRHEIRKQLAYVLGLGIRSFRIIEEDLFIGPDIIVQSGICVFFNENGQEFDRSRFTTVWKREGDTWRIHRDFVV